MSDMSSIGKTMSLFYTENSYFPDPTDSIEVTYSGSLAWRQGTYGEATRRLGKRMSKVPNDPLTGNEYAYSVTHSRQEYELGSILEKSQGSL
jgi:Flp pilus assembly protein TadD